MPRKTSKKAKSKAARAPWGTTVVAWCALIIAITALGISISEKPWFKQLNEQFATNLDLIMEEVRQTPEEPDATEGVEAAREAALEGNAEQMVAHLREAVQALRAGTEEISEELQEQRRSIIRDLDRIRRAGEATSESAEKLEATMGQIEQFKAGVEEND